MTNFQDLIENVIEEAADNSKFFATAWKKAREDQREEILDILSIRDDGLSKVDSIETHQYFKMLVSAMDRTRGAKAKIGRAIKKTALNAEDHKADLEYFWNGHFTSVESKKRFVKSLGLQDNVANKSFEDIDSELIVGIMMRTGKKLRLKNYRD